MTRKMTHHFNYTLFIPLLLMFIDHESQYFSINECQMNNRYCKTSKLISNVTQLFQHHGTHLTGDTTLPQDPHKCWRSQAKCNFALTATRSTKFRQPICTVENKGFGEIMTYIEAE